MTTTNQGKKPCPKCGSWYRNGEYCNKNNCNEFIGIEKESVVSFGRKNQITKIWDKKLHRYLTQDEMKRRTEK